jgi:hypothetical protein
LPRKFRLTRWEANWLRHKINDEKTDMRTLNKISKNLWRAVLLLLAVSASTGSATAQTWQTVLAYQPAVPKGKTPFAACSSVAADGLGNVFSGGSANDGEGTEDGQVLQTTDTTETAWFLSDDSNTEPAADITAVNNIGFDSSGNLYSVGQLFPEQGSGAPYWYVRKSSNRGATWTTVDLYQYSSGSYPWADATGFTADNSGNIYVVGGAYDGSLKRHWLVRKSSNSGETWANADDEIIGNFPSSAAFVASVGIFVAGDPGTLGWSVRFSANAGATWANVDAPFPTGAGAWSVASDYQGNVYVTGSTPVTAAYSEWVTRKSSNGGQTWQTVDTYTLAPDKSAVGHGLGVTAAGTIVAVGQANDASGTTHWIAREPNSSGVWQTVDNYQLVSGSNAAAYGVVTDATGNLLVTGSAVNSAKGTFWVVRKLP